MEYDQIKKSINGLETMQENADDEIKDLSKQVFKLSEVKCDRSIIDNIEVSLTTLISD